MSKINTVETKPKQSHFRQFFEKDIHIQPILLKWVGPLVLFLKAYHIEDLNSKNIQSLITMDEDRSFCNIFCSYNVRVFDTMKFVKILRPSFRIICKSKKFLDFPGSSIFQQKI